MIYVVALNWGYEGHGLPYLAFNDKETALKWIASNSTYCIWSLAEVPIYPQLPGYGAGEVKDIITHN